MVRGGKRVFAEGTLTGRGGDTNLKGRMLMTKVGGEMGRKKAQHRKGF